MYTTLADDILFVITMGMVVFTMGLFALVSIHSVVVDIRRKFRG